MVWRSSSSFTSSSSSHWVNQEAIANQPTTQVVESSERALLVDVIRFIRNDDFIVILSVCDCWAKEDGQEMDAGLEIVIRTRIRSVLTAN